MKRATRNLVLAFALLGLASSLASSYVHYQLLRDPSYTSFCDFSATVSCQAVYQSRFGSLFGVPVAVGGVIWFTLVLLLARSARPVEEGSTRESGASVQGYLFVLSTAALSAVLYLAYASFFILQTVCILCVLTYIAVVGVFLASGSRNDVAVSSLPRRAMSDLRALAARPLSLAVAVLFMAGAASAVAFFPREATSLTTGTAALAAPQQSEFERWYSSQPRVPIAVPADGASVVIVKFNDYQCPACGTTYMNYRSILSKWQAERPGAVAFVTKDYPLDPECNSQVPSMVHEAACEAAVAVRLSRERGRGDAMEEWLYTHQSGLTPAAVRQAAREIGQVPDYDARLAATTELIKGDVEFGRQLGVRVTPTFFINGVRVEGGLQPQFFDAAIAYELARAASPAPGDGQRD